MSPFRFSPCCDPCGGGPVCLGATYHDEFDGILDTGWGFEHSNGYVAGINATLEMLEFTRTSGSGTAGDFYRRDEGDTPDSEITLEAIVHNAPDGTTEVSQIGVGFGSVGSPGTELAEYFFAADFEFNRFVYAIDGGSLTAIAGTPQSGDRLTMHITNDGNVRVQTMLVNGTQIAQITGASSANDWTGTQYQKHGIVIRSHGAANPYIAGRVDAYCADLDVMYSPGTDCIPCPSPVAPFVFLDIKAGTFFNRDCDNCNQLNNRRIILPQDNLVVPGLGTFCQWTTLIDHCPLPGFNPPSTAGAVDRLWIGFDPAAPQVSFVWQEEFAPGQFINTDRIDFNFFIVQAFCSGSRDSDQVLEAVAPARHVCSSNRSDGVRITFPPV